MASQARTPPHIEPEHSQKQWTGLRPPRHGLSAPHGTHTSKPAADGAIFPVDQTRASAASPPGPLQPREGALRAMVPEDDLPKVSVLMLLAEKSTVEIMRELAGGRLRPSELERRLPCVAHSALLRRLGDLAQWGAVAHERIVELSPRAYYSLTSAGRALLEIPDAAARWERQRIHEQAQLNAPRKPPRPRADARRTPSPAPAEP